jgi:mannosyltransferase OCH1-like enzyme
MNLSIVFTNRLLKIIGNIAKALAYPFHFVFKKKRFVIPKYSKALLKTAKKTKIPKIIWQTNYTNHVSLPVYLNYLTNRLLSLTYEYRYMGTEDILEFIKEEAPKDIVDAYIQLKDGAAQADVWRLFVLNHIGGIYMDIDAHLVWPISKIVNEDDTEIFLLNKEHYTNYFMASAKDNDILKKSLELIVENIQQRRVDEGVYSLTGPNVLNIAIDNKDVNSRFYRYTCVQGSFTNEYFQYIDKPRGKWTHAKQEDILEP